jgi:hypothetical protein
MLCFVSMNVSSLLQCQHGFLQTFLHGNVQATASGRHMHGMIEIAVPAATQQPDHEVLGAVVIPASLHDHVITAKPALGFCWQSLEPTSCARDGSLKSSCACRWQQRNAKHV